MSAAVRSSRSRSSAAARGAEANALRAAVEA